MTGRKYFVSDGNNGKIRTFNVRTIAGARRVALTTMRFTSKDLYYWQTGRNGREIFLGTIRNGSANVKPTWTAHGVVYDLDKHGRLIQRSKRSV